MCVCVCVCVCLCKQLFKVGHAAEYIFLYVSNIYIYVI